MRGSLSICVSSGYSFLTSFPVNVESESAYKPEQILPVAIRIMRSKIKVLKTAAEKLKREVDGDAPTEEVAVEGDVIMNS